MRRKRPPYDNDVVEGLINKHIHSERDRGIMRRSLCDGIGYEALAEEFGLSRSQIARIVPREEKVLWKKMI